MISKLLKKNEKGFTLMEMLIVVAIIAVLVAIAIPTFKSSLDKAKVATDAANIRAGYASAMMTIMQKELNGEAITADKTYYLQKDGSVAEATSTTGDYSCKITQGDYEVAGQKISWTVDKGITYVYTASTGKLAITPTT